MILHFELNFNNCEFLFNSRCSPLKVFLVVLVICGILAAAMTTLVLVLKNSDDKYSPVQKFEKAAIVSDAKPCSSIGK